MRLMGRILVAACAALLVTAGASAQLSKGFRGKVLDRDGKTVADCPVIIEDMANPQNRYETKTDSHGTYVYTGIPYSDKGYKVTVRIPNLPEVTKMSKPKLMDITDLNFDMREDLKMVEAEVKASAALEAKQLFDLSDYEGAILKADETLADEKEPAENRKAARLIKAKSLEKLERSGEAITIYEAIYKESPEDLNVLGELVQLYGKTGDKAKAEAYKKEFVAKGGTVTGQTYNEGVQALNAGDAAKAAELFKKACEEDPNDADAHKNWGIAYAQLNRPAEAIEQLKLYLKLKPNAEDAATWQAAIDGLQAMIDEEAKPKKKH